MGYILPKQRINPLVNKNKKHLKNQVKGTKRSYKVVFQTKYEQNNLWKRKRNFALYEKKKKYYKKIENDKHLPIRKRSIPDDKGTIFNEIV